MSKKNENNNHIYISDISYKVLQVLSKKEKRTIKSEIEFLIMKRKEDFEKGIAV